MPYIKDPSTKANASKEGRIDRKMVELRSSIQRLDRVTARLWALLSHPAVARCEEDLPRREDSILSDEIDAMAEQIGELCASLENLAELCGAELSETKLVRVE